MDGPGIRRKQYGFKSNAHQGAGAATSTSSGKRKGKASVGGGKKPPIKVVFIGNPVRVTTSEAGFRALVQELTGRHADPYKYSGGGGSSGAAIDVDADDSSGGSPVEPHHQAGAMLLPSPVSTLALDAAGAAQVSVPAYDDDDDDSFAPQLIDNSYSVFSPPTFL
uniref:Sigma factor binding protein 1 n=1 Tax=Saccharum hybrid cultivar R570 TaxID=131158 RepID=A0A059Q2W5_9POAL|nr:sigma factor binding protein 1 [Saccharum hybrid cultivar R570]